MKLRDNQAGFSIAVVALSVAIVGVLAFAGYNVYSNQNQNESVTSQSAPSSKSPDVSTAPEINKTSDLDKASNTLDQNDAATANTSDSSQLDQELASF